jgi:hypothetical protein
MKPYRESKVKASFILNLGVKWRRMGDFMARPLYLKGKNPRTYQREEWKDPRTSLDVLEVKKKTPVPPYI